MDTSSANDLACIFSITLWRWAFTIRVVQPIARAICLLESPRTTSSKTSREDKGDWPAARLIIHSNKISTDANHYQLKGRLAEMNWRQRTKNWRDITCVCA